MLAPCLRYGSRNPASNRLLSAQWSTSHLNFYSSASRFASTTAASTTGSNKNKWSSTLLLPKTDFPMKHKDPVKAEMQWRDRTTSELYRWQWENNEGKVFILHDGPPYANGNLHMGHSLNKLLKDFINRYKAIKGHRVKYIPGWDCHGLPIEHKALKALGKSHLKLSPLEVRHVARKTAMEAIQDQREEFRQLGIMADWDSETETYRTMDQAYEIRQLNLLKSMVQNNLILHRSRPTYYSPSSRTVLAEAELSYKDDHKSHSAYVYFSVPEEYMSADLKRLWKDVAAGRELGLAIWTTTAWTLAANQAVAVSPTMEYAIVERKSDPRLLVIATERLEPLKEALGDMKVLGRITGQELVGTKYQHLFTKPSLPPPEVILAKHVTAAAGTSLVHTAPAHGQEDYEAFREAFAGSVQAQASEMRCPVDDEGKFTNELADWTDDKTLPERLVGKSVLGDAVPEMIAILKEKGILLHTNMLSHRYPCDWKTKEPVILRASPQWFANIEGIKQSAIQAIASVDFKPEQSKRRLESFVLGRSEWCISRQRSWGVPIPVLYDVSTGEAHLSAEILDHIIPVLAAKGTDYWWSDEIDAFVPEHLKSTGKQFRKGTDTMDVWFDSGSSWTLIKELGLRSTKEPVADVYLEGSDQHRGWFQSSLLTYLAATEGERNVAPAPYGTLITHGMVLDQDGQKMSKSLGNGLTPMEVIHGGKDKKKLPSYGTDIMRLWAAQVDYTRDVAIGTTSLSAAAENARKIRNAIKFILGNAYRGDSQPPSLASVQLGLVDRWILDEIAELETYAIENFEIFDFNRVLQALNTFISGTLSTTYFEMNKDILYCDASDSPRRQASIAVLSFVLSRMMYVLSPIMPHLAEEVLHRTQHKSREMTATTFKWDEEAQNWKDKQVKQEMQPLLAIRQQVMQLLEEARTAKTLRSAAEAVLVIRTEDTHLQASLEQYSDEMPPFMSTARVIVNPAETQASEWTYEASIDASAVKLSIEPSNDHKCPRCWIHTAAVEDSLCKRCDHVVHS
ncbi:isoleucine-tRNA ligase [Naganishia albida]|nr:isoleucine-tRNA ligase [Naganishia albida]